MQDLLPGLIDAMVCVCTVVSSRPHRAAPCAPRCTRQAVCCQMCVARCVLPDATASQQTRAQPAGRRVFTRAAEKAKGADRDGEAAGPRRSEESMGPIVGPASTENHATHQVETMSGLRAQICPGARASRPLTNTPQSSTSSAVPRSLRAPVSPGYAPTMWRRF